MDDPTPVDLDRLTAVFPKEALQTRQGGGGKALTYIATHSVIRRLNDATRNRWDFRLIRFELIGDTYVAIGELTIPGLGTRTGIGVQKVAERSGEDLVKGCASDALKKAATCFGVGLELYGPDYEEEAIQADEAAKTALRAAHAAIRGKAPGGTDDHEALHALGCAAYGVSTLTALGAEQVGWLRKWIDRQDAMGLGIKLEKVRAIERAGTQQALTAVGAEVANAGLSDDLLRMAYTVRQRQLKP